MARFPGILCRDTVSPRNVSAFSEEKNKSLSLEKSLVIQSSEFRCLLLLQNKCGLSESLPVNWVLDIS